MIDWKKTRPVLIAAAGVYILYIAYSLFSERHTDSAMPLWLNCLFSGLFLLAAAAIFVYAYILWKRAKAEEKAMLEQFAMEESAQPGPDGSGDTAPSGTDDGASPDTES